MGFQIVHLFNPGKCLQQIVLEDQDLFCGNCKSKIGFIYSYQNKWKTFIYEKYKRFSKDIKEWVRANTKDRNPLDELSQREWRELLHSIQQISPESIFLGYEDESAEEDN